MDTPNPGPAPDTVAAPRDFSGDITSVPPFWDHSVMAMLFANGVTLAGAVVQHWSASPIMWVYWGQSVAIGVTNVIRILSLKEFSTAGFTSNGKQVAENEAGKRSTAGFFAVHFGIFHLVYAIFLASGRFGPMPPGLGPLTVVANVGMFGAAHLVSLLRMHGNDLRSRRPNLGALMFYPYLRILPMHLGIIFGSTLPLGALPLFIVLKTGSDLGMHAIERRMFKSVD